MRDDEFQWDDEKAAQNLATRGISFEVARLALDDAFAGQRVDWRERYGQDRFILLGMVQGRLLAVAYSLRGEREHHFSPLSRVTRTRTLP